MKRIATATLLLIAVSSSTVAQRYDEDYDDREECYDDGYVEDRIYDFVLDEVSNVLNCDAIEQAEARLQCFDRETSKFRDTHQ